MDRHRLWRAVAYDVEQLEKDAPEGYEPVARVFITGRLEPVEVGYVETRRNPEYPWVRLQAMHASEDAGEMTPDRYWVHVHEGLIERVEIHFRRRRGTSPLGFTHTVADASTEPEPESSIE